jgi:hypothetical protein
MRMYTHRPGHRPSSSDNGTVEIVAVVVLVLGKCEHQGQHAPAGLDASPCSTIADDHHAADAWTRIFTPGHEILAQGLPAPDI